MHNSPGIIAAITTTLGVITPTVTSAQALQPGAVVHQRLLNADDEPGNWMSWGRTFDEQRFSPLQQIDDGNVADLGLALYHTFG